MKVACSDFLELFFILFEWAKICFA